VRGRLAQPQGLLYRIEPALGPLSDADFRAAIERAMAVWSATGATSRKRRTGHLEQPRDLVGRQALQAQPLDCAQIPLACPVRNSDAASRADPPSPGPQLRPARTNAAAASQRGAAAAMSIPGRLA
jgi:hypothetical protein